MGFSRQEYWSGGCHPPGDLPDPRIEPETLTSPALAGGFFTTGATTTRQNPGQSKNCRNTATFQDKDIPEDLNSPVSRLYGHPIGTFKFRIPKYIFQKFLVCYITQHISLGDSNFGFWGFFWHHFPEPGRAVWAESQMHGGGVSEMESEDRRACLVFLIMVSRHRRVSRLQETRPVMSQSTKHFPVRADSNPLTSEGSWQETHRVFLEDRSHSRL